MALALIVNLILCVGIVVAIVGHLAWESAPHAAMSAR